MYFYVFYVFIRKGSSRYKNADFERCPLNREGGWGFIRERDEDVFIRKLEAVNGDKNFMRVRSNAHYSIRR